METIEVAAIQDKGIVYSVPRPGRHDAVVRLMVEKHGYTEVKSGCTQGFWTSEGRFVDRLEAVTLAVKSGQILSPKWPPKLYSEDLW